MSENTEVKTEVNIGVNGNPLKVGNPGNKGGTGRPKSAIRASCAESFDVRIRVAEEIADDPDASRAERLKALEVLGTFGGLKQTDVTSGDAALQTVTVRFEAETPMSTIDAILASE